LYWELITVCFEIHTKNEVFGQDVGFAKEKYGGTNIDNWNVLHLLHKGSLRMFDREIIAVSS
jgi:hypothetical protein